MPTYLFFSAPPPVSADARPALVVKNGASASYRVITPRFMKQLHHTYSPHTNRDTEIHENQ